MGIRLKSKYKAEEIQTILNSKLETNWRQNWDKSIYVGNVKNNEIKYIYRKARVRNSFVKTLKGTMVEKDSATNIDVKFVSEIISAKNLLVIWGLSLFMVLVGALTASVDGVYLMGCFVFGVLGTMFTIGTGFIANIIPISEKTKKKLIGFLEENIEAEVIKT